MQRSTAILGSLVVLTAAAFVTCSQSKRGDVDAGASGSGASGSNLDGSAATGGSPASGGTPSNGGAPGNGGAPTNGGAPASGGAPANGGAPVSDGAPEASGTPAPDAAEAGSAPLRDTCSGVPAAALVAAWTADPHFCLIRFADGVTNARQIAFAPNGDLFVSTPGQVVVLFDDDHDGVSAPNERATFAMAPSGNHGVALTATHLYASSPTTVYRFAYASGQRAATGAAEIVVHDIPTGGHVTRTLLVDSQNRLYVSIGSASNVDAPADPTTPPAMRAQIRRYDLGAIPTGGYAATGGELFAAGLRNEVGLTIDRLGRLWGVENGRDDLHALGDVAMHNDNPAEEVNLFDVARPGRNYGYPFCWSEGVWSAPMALGTGTQHLDPDVPGGFTEAMCQNPNLVVPPALGLHAHLAPLDVVEYAGTAYPSTFVGDLFVTAHGSWDRDVAVGRTILRLHMGPTGPTQADNFIGQLGANGVLAEGGWAIRPVSIRVDAAGLLTFSDDMSSTIHKIGYRP